MGGQDHGRPAVAQAGARAEGSSLTMGSKGLEIVAGTDVKAADFLGDFASWTNFHHAAQSYGLETWHFPEVDLEITCNHRQQIVRVGLSSPR